MVNFDNVFQDLNFLKNYKLEKTQTKNVFL